MKTLTVIVPVFNGEKEISRCLKSIFRQNYPGLNIIAVNDGSSDNSLKVIAHAIKKYNKHAYPVKVVSQANAGVAAARNLGIQIADTDYVAFADQDDLLREGFAETFMQAVQSADHDMVIGGFCRVDTNGKITRKMAPKQGEWSKFCYTYPWGRIIRRQFLMENNIRFLKTGIGEDVYFDLVAYSYTDDIVMLKNCLYVWSDNPVSVSNRQYTRINTQTDPVYTFDCILRDVQNENYKNSDFLEYYFIKFTVWYLMTNVRQSSKEDIIFMRNRLFGWLKTRNPAFAQNPYISPVKPKGDRFINRISVWMYMVLYRLKLDGVVLKRLGR
ncbi:MAG: glycosyltransferase family 2 protein [Coprococcus sp.]